MNHKILLADDSATIQKVIRITLANQGYDIVEASSEVELFNHLPTFNPSLVLLDFNLSEQINGYELTTKIKSFCPSTKILLLLGTFDTIDDNLMHKSGASDKIVKPFDSNRFIAICKRLVDSYEEENDSNIQEPNYSSSENLGFSTEEDQWEMTNAPTSSVKQQMEESTSSTQLKTPNLLDQQISDWGMSVPGLIDPVDKLDTFLEVPPVILASGLNHEKINTSTTTINETSFSQKFPENDDLAYPIIEKTESASHLKIEKKENHSELISLDQLNEAQDIQFDSYEQPAGGDAKDIQLQIQDEIEENLWQADEFEDIKKEVALKIEEMQSSFDSNDGNHDNSSFKSSEFKDKQYQSSQNNSLIDMDVVKNEIEVMVKKYVQEYMDNLFQKNAEKVAWEVIPDLAENLIRQELSKISSKVLQDTSES